MKVDFRRMGMCPERLLLAAALWVCTFNPLLAQITGTVIDSRTKKPVPEVEVFIQGTTHVAVSDDAGVFALQGVHPGINDLVLYRKGYMLFKSSIRLLEGKAYSLNLSIDPARKEKSKIKTDDNSEQALQRLKEALVGKENDTSTMLLNVETLSLNGSAEAFSVQCLEPLMINNFSLGYQVRYFLQQGFIAPDKNILKGYYYFLPMQATGSDQDREWAEHRLVRYAGSVIHFLKSLVSGNTAKEGFQCLTTRGESLDQAGLIAATGQPGYYKLLLPDTLVVMFQPNKAAPFTSQFIAHGQLAVNREGIMLKSENLEIRGAMKENGVIASMPLNYELFVPKDEDFTRFYEKTYVQTDKPYYYPGEPLWFKGYINYQVPAWRDSLCRVMYVELISARKKIVLSRTLKIDSGMFHGDVILPDSLPPGPYYLRAYTNLSRNFGSSALFIKPIPVLNMTDKADRNQEVNEVILDSPLTITADKPLYHTREKITLTFHAKDSSGLPIATNLSVSVTDAEQVVAVPEPATILGEFPFTEEMTLVNMDFKFGAEFGVSFMARFLNDRGQPEKTNLNILQLRTSNMMVAQSDEQGIFWRTGLQFYDSAQFSFKSDKAKGRPYGRVELLRRETPEVDFKGSRLNIAVSKMEFAQRLISDYEVPKGARLLQEVTVKGTRIDNDANDVSQGFKSHYGTPDRVIKGEDVSMKPDLLYALVGKVPGLTIVPSTGVVVFSRAIGTSLSQSASPLVTVNDVPMDGDAGEVLRSINPTTVERIAITRRTDVLYGSQGRNGVIAVYTKLGTTGFEDPEKEKNFQVLSIPGYSRPRSFKSPDYDDSQTDQSRPDYRATIYWNPWIITDSKTGEVKVTFFSADLEGRYRVVAEGVTRTGEPVRQVYYLTVDNQ